MLNFNWDKHKNYNGLIIYFYIVQSRKTNFQSFIQFLNIYGLTLRRITSSFRRSEMEKQILIKNLTKQANYVAFSSREITKEQLQQLIQLLFSKYSNCAIFGFYYQNRIWRTNLLLI